MNLTRIAALPGSSGAMGTSGARLERTSARTPRTPQATVPASPSATAVNIVVNKSDAADVQVSTTAKDNADGTRQIDIYVDRKIKETMDKMDASLARQQQVRATMSVMPGFYTSAEVALLERR